MASVAVVCGRGSGGDGAGSGGVRGGGSGGGGGGGGGGWWGGGAAVATVTAGAGKNFSQISWSQKSAEAQISTHTKRRNNCHRVLTQCPKVVPMFQPFLLLEPPESMP